MRMRYPPRPGYRKRGRIPVAKYDEAVDLAAKTTIQNASRVYGISPPSIRQEMIARGIPRRRVGNLTLDELGQMGRLFVL